MFAMYPVAIFFFVLFFLRNHQFLYIRLPAAESQPKQVPMASEVKVRSLPKHYFDRDEADQTLPVSCESLRDAILEEPVDFDGILAFLTAFHDKMMVAEMSALEKQFPYMRPNIWEQADLSRSVFNQCITNIEDKPNVVSIAGRGLFENTGKVRLLEGVSGNFGMDAAAYLSVDGAKFIAIADGVGKSPLTDIVSRLAVHLAATAFKAFPQVSLSKYFERLLLRIQNLFYLGRLKGATTLVLARITDDLIELVSVGDSTAIAVRNDGRVDITSRGEYKFNSPYCLYGEKPLNKNLVTFYSVDAKKVDTLILATDGVTDNVFVKDIIEAKSAEEIAARAIKVFSGKDIRPTPFKDGTRGKKDDVTVARISFTH